MILSREQHFLLSLPVDTGNHDRFFYPLDNQINNDSYTENYDIKFGLSKAAGSGWLILEP